MLSSSLHLVPRPPIPTPRRGRIGHDVARFPRWARARRLAAALAFAALAHAGVLGPVAEAAVLKVSHSAGGGHPTIGAALAVAVDGDVILIDDGVYVENVVIDGLRVDLVADNGANVTLRTASADPALVVRNVGGPRQVLVRGMRFDSSLAPLSVPGPSPLVRVEGSAGVVRFEECTLNAVAGSCSAGGVVMDGGVAFEVVASTATSLVRCTLRGGDAYFGFPWQCCAAAGAALVVDAASDVVLYRTQLLGGAPSSLGGCPGAPGLVDPGLAVTVPADDSRSIRITSPLRTGESGTLSLGDVPLGEQVILFVAAAPAHLALPVYDGALLIGPPVMTLALGALPAEDVSIPITASGVPPAGVDVLVAHVQAAFVGGAGAARLGPVTMVHVLNPAL